MRFRGRRSPFEWEADVKRQRLLATAAVSVVTLAAIAAGVIPAIPWTVRVAAQARAAGNVDWTLHNLDYGGTRFSTMDQINRSNVKTLYPRWLFQHGVIDGVSNQTTPVIVNGVMYVTDSRGSVYAVDAADGHLLWNFDVTRLIGGGAREGYVFRNRGVTYGDGVIYTAGGSFLFALDAKTGKPLPTFGENGQASVILDVLKKRYEDVKTAISMGYWFTTAPQYYKGVLYIGSKGKMLQNTYGARPRLLPVELHNDFGAPPEVMMRVPNQAHEMNWVNAIRGTDTISSPFSYAAHLNEIMLLGVAALRAGTRLQYDGANMKVKRNETYRVKDIPRLATINQKVIQDNAAALAAFPHHRADRLGHPQSLLHHPQPRGGGRRLSHRHAGGVVQHRREPGGGASVPGAVDSCGVCAEGRQGH